MARGKHSPYTDTMGRFHTKALFVETISKELLAKGVKPVYTLKGDPAYTDIREIFIDSDDPTGYTFAMQAFNSWEHLKHLRTLSWFAPLYDQWLEELEVKMRAEAIRNIVKQSFKDKGTTAAKYIADRGWETKRGRPSKDEIEKERKQQAAMRRELDADASRISIDPLGYRW